jgi:hypothetical protein
VSIKEILSAYLNMALIDGHEALEDVSVRILVSDGRYWGYHGNGKKLKSKCRVRRAAPSFSSH